MNANHLVSVPALSLNNISAVSIATVDENIRAAIATDGDIVTLQKIASGAARVADVFYRCVLAVAAGRGVLSLPCNEEGKYPAKADAIQMILKAVSEDSTNGLRKQASKYMNYAWKVSQNGIDVFSLPSVSALAKAANPAKIVDVQSDEAGINQAAITQAEAAKVAQAEAEQAAKVAQADADKAAKAEKAAKAAMNALETAKAQAIADIEIMRDEINVALYGTNDERKALRAKYPKQ